MIASEQLGAVDAGAGGCRHRWSSRRVDGFDVASLIERYLGREPLFCFERPESATTLVAVGSAHSIRTQGRQRFVDASRAAQTVLAALAGQAPDRASLATPLLVGGFGFSSGPSSLEAWREFPPCWLYLPRELWIARGGEYYHVVTESCRHGEPAYPAYTAASSASGRSAAADSRLAARPDGDQQRRIWNERVRRVLAEIEEGRLQKLVLSRRVSGSLTGEAAAARVFERFCRQRPSCFSFLVGAAQSCFVGSTPELLVRRRADRVETHSLAGTVPRSEQQPQSKDSAAVLLHSAKNAREQAEVTRGIVEALAPVTSALEIGERASVMSVPEAFHLHTPICGRLAAPATALDLAGLLHPTPAVCGMPRAEAGDWLAGEESDRGWYSGAVGWMDPAGDGEFAVALRAALLERDAYTCWAGAGIVDGSQPDAEFDETEAKMRAAIDCLEVCRR